MTNEERRAAEMRSIMKSIPAKEEKKPAPKKQTKKTDEEKK